MKLKKWARMLLAVAPFLAGCEGFWDVPSGSGSGGGNGTASGVFYVLNQKTAEVAGFSFAAGSTSLTKVTNSPYALQAAPFAAAISPNGGFLYVSTAAGIFVYSVNSSTGELTLQNNSQVLSADIPITMAVDPSGGWLVEAVSGTATVNAIPLDATTGILLSGASEQTVNLPANATSVQQLTMTRSTASPNPYVFITMGTNGFAVIPFTASTSGNPFGTVKTFAPKNTGGGDASVAVDLTHEVLYVGETVAVSGNNPGGVRMFTIGANSTLTEVTGSPFASGGLGPSAIVPTSSFVYAANRAVFGGNTGNIKAFAITVTGGTPTGLTDVTDGTIAAGVATVGMTEDGKGLYMLAVNNSGSPDLNAYTIDSTTGALKSYATVATGADPVQPVAIVAQ